MTSPFQPNKVKIGYTTRSVYERAEELTKRLGIKMNVEYVVSRSHIKDLESEIHRFLRNYRCRFNGKYGQYSEEGFCISVAQAIKIVDSIRNREINIIGVILPLDVNIEEYIKKLSYNYAENNKVHRDIKEEMKSVLVFWFFLAMILMFLLS